MTYRDATLDERRFVRSSWASSYRSAHAAGFFCSEDWAEFSHRTINRILDRPGTRTIVAYDRHDDFLFGFIAGDVTRAIPIVYYVYVKDPYRSEMTTADGRRSGPRYARGLFAALGIDPARPFLYACRTSISTRLAHKIPGGKFVPAVARYANYTTYQEQHDER